MSGSQGRKAPPAPPMPQWREPDPHDRYGTTPADPYAQTRDALYGRGAAPTNPGPGGYGAGGFSPQPPVAPQRTPQSRAPQASGYSQGNQPPQASSGHAPPQGGGQPSFDNFGQVLGRVAPSPRTAPPAHSAPPAPRQDPQQVPSYSGHQQGGGYADQQAADPNGYHLGYYAAPQQPYGGGQQEADYNGYGDLAAHQGYAAADGMRGQRPPIGHHDAPYGYQPRPGEIPPETADGDDDYDYEYEEEPRRSRRWMIVAALIGSIGIGGGMAYGYKAMMGDGRGRTQVVKASTDPTKTIPDERGGKRFANTDSKFMNRLQPDGTNPAAAGAVDSAGVRRVQTVTVGKDLATDGPRTASQSAAGGGVPGMILVDRDSMPPPPPSPQASFTGGSPLPPMAAPSPPPRAIDRLPPPPSPPSPPRVAARTEPPPVRTPPARVAAPRPDASDEAAAPAGAAAAKARPTRNGYVAVLGYQKSQLDAMKMMADLQQQYASLQGKQMEVIASDQSSRGLGTIYRVVVGPAGGLGAARNVCAELTQAGMPASRCYTIVPR